MVFNSLKQLSNQVSVYLHLPPPFASRKPSFKYTFTRPSSFVNDSNGLVGDAHQYLTVMIVDLNQVMPRLLKIQILKRKSTPKQPHWADVLIWYVFWY